MLVCMGMGAQTSPAAGAYPVEGKTYYLFANKWASTPSTDRYYLYWDNTNSVLKNAENSKENNDYYKWTVTLSDGKYTITNVGTGKSLMWSSGLTLGDTGLQYDLSKDVNYTACVSLYGNTDVGGRWCCVKNDTRTFDNGYKFSSFVNNSDYSINFVFEEVLDAHSLTNGSYYTIYCDNDSKQYFRTNGSSLTVTSTAPTAASSDCIWKCIVNGDYYNFQNLATGQYLGWKAMQASAYNFTVATTAAIHDGCATIYGVGAKRYLNLNVSGSFDQGTGTFNKVTTNYCSDFRFDEVTPTYGTPVTDLSTLSNSKAYVITNARGTWNFADDATSMTAVTGYNLVDDAQHVAIIQHESNYYLYSVNAGKYLTGSNALTSMPTDNEQIEIVATGNASYPWFFRFKNLKDGNDKYTNNINTDGNPRIVIDGWGPNGSNSWGEIDDGNRNAILPAGDYDLSAAIDMFSTRSVDYTLQWSDGTQIGETVSDVTVTVSGDAADFVPAAFVATGVDLSYSPATITAETETVTVTATWNGPFQISSAPSDGNFASGTKWYTIAHNYSERANNYIWKYNGTDNVVPETVATDNFGGVTNNHLFCFVGDPYTGFTIYNKAAGTSMKVYSSGQSDQVTMNATATLFIPSRTDNYAVSDGYFSLKPSGSSYYLNWNTSRLAGYTSADNGSTCWVVAPGQYYLNFIDGLYLDAPVGAVGTRSYFQTVADPTTAKSTISTLRTIVAENMYSDQLNTLNGQLTPIAESSVITLTDGYYRVLSAMKGFNNTAAWYYNPATSTDHITWAKAATTAEQQANSIFKFTANEDKWNIYSPNAQKYMIHDNTAFQAQTGTIGDEAGDVTITSIGSAQYTLMMNVQTIHCNGHDKGNNSTGTLINYNANGLGQASTWYFVKVDNIEVALNGPIDGYYYATLYLPFDVTISGANAYTMVQSGDWMVPTQLEDNEVPAGTAVLLKGSGTSATATINTGSAFSTSNDNDLLGVYVPTDFALDETANDENDDVVSCTSEYFLGVYNSTVGFYRSGVASKTGIYTLGANKAYLESANASRGFSIKWNDDEVTGIRSIDNVQKTLKNGAFYDLSGRRVENPQHGLYIVNGKKVVIK